VRETQEENFSTTHTKTSNVRRKSLTCLTTRLLGYYVILKIWYFLAMTKPIIQLSWNRPLVNYKYHFASYLNPPLALGLGLLRLAEKLDRSY
jgi:hypothetical protein